MEKTNIGTKEIDKKEYVLVDIYNKNELPFGTVYHYMCWDDDKYFLNNQEILENSYHIKIIEDYLGYNETILYKKQNRINSETLKKLKIYQLTEKEKENFYQRTVEELARTFEDIDKEKILTRLRKKGEIFVVEKEQKINKKGANGLYDTTSNDIYLKVKEFNDVSFHELIHKISGTIAGATMRKRGFWEAGTELIVQKTRSGAKKLIDPIEFVNGAYPYNVILLQQMEYIMGKSSHLSILNGDFEFLKEFKEKYGTKATYTISHIMNRLLNNKMPLEKKYKYFLKAQNIMLEKCFDRKMKEIYNVKSAEKYLKNIQEFEKIMVIPLTHEFYQKYYSEKIERIVEILKSNGENEEEIKHFIVNYKESIDKKRESDSCFGNQQIDVESLPTSIEVNEQDLVQNNKIVTASERNNVINKIKKILQYNKRKNMLDKDEMKNI